ncbi:class I adenylate-forming enzyme family protein [Microbacterium immunditiarum]|uniref:Acyl-CoA synthetase (AMP-forming)/AMP-acid ligase II n=1 Tax=Microbacterium immunditiarum TaxID=337480 RepID=A0A7Y9GL30_9MICO|nr:AMP-binding protein [Microbacterium immunditiarum]NYE18417.1 acyl-CoA synthetase (AMP-forming)/AMP-acid ligase II [Microbacterium immunditiarum]
MTSPTAPLSAILDQSWAEALEVASRRHGDRVAFHFDGAGWHQALTFAEWREASHRVAAGLAALGVRAGDRVAALAPGSAMWPILQTACSHLGAIIVPINTRYREDELRFVLARAEPAVIVLIGRYHVTDYVELVAAAGAVPELVTIDAPGVALEPAGGPGGRGRRTWAELLALGAAAPTPPIAGRATDAVLLQFTSGTSAFPKGALLSSRATLGATWYLAERMEVTSDDVYFSTQPMYHVGGSVATTLMALGAAPTMIVPERYSPEAVFELVPKYGCTVRTGQAAMYAMELAHPGYRREFFTTLTKAWSGGTPELRRIISREMGVPVMTTIYGLTETAGTTTINALDDPEEVWLHSCGRAIPGVEVAVRSEPGAPVVTTPGVEGEIVVRGWSVMLGYFRDDAATAQAIDADGWFHTGDIGRLDHAGNLFFVDRIKDMIKPGGENVSAAEVERIIRAIDGIAEVAVVGRPDERLGQVPVAFVSLHPGRAFDPGAIVGHCAAVMASFKVPREVHLVESWPMTESGKILKRELTARLAQNRASVVGPTG